ncbi:MAG: hypothetical protein KKH80_02910, partial [Candidatus Omnitrophica bacterium]|nr:hypothetical protein [Candidatus Omnitrophota bacterium]
MLKLAGKIILLFFLTLLAIEGGLRLYNKINPSFIFPDNSYNRFRAKPNSRDYDFRLNSKGFKDQEFENNKQPGVFRILGIGDSFAFGVVPYKYNFLTLLENKLNQDSKHFEVINMGIPYISVDDYLGMLVNEGLELKPDMIVCCFFIGNDFVNIPKGANNLYLTSLLKFFFKIMPKYKGKIIHTDSDYFDDKPTFDFNTFLGIEKVGSWVFIKDSKVFTKQLQYVVSKLKKMQDICSRR